MVTSIKESRESHGFSQARAAVLAKVAINTWRTFEVAPEAVSPKKRAACEAALTTIRKATADQPMATSAA
jgi:hypothetical protein